MIFVSSANAGVVYWDGSTSTAWATGSNWVGNVAPANSTVTDIAGFNFSISPPNAPNAGTRSINGLIIGDGSTAVPAFTLAGTNLRVGDAGIVKNASSLATLISTGVTLAADQSWINNSATSLTVSGIIVSNGFDLTFDGSGNMTARGVVSGNGSIIKAGTGSLTLNASNTYTGGTVITGGTLIVDAVANKETLGSGRLEFNGGGATLQLADSVGKSNRNYVLSQTGIINTNGFDLTLDGIVSGAGGITKVGAGTLELGGTNAFTGIAEVQSGTLSLAGGVAISDTVAVVTADVAGAVLHIIDDETIGSLSGGGASGGNVDLSRKTLILGGNDASTAYGGQWVGTNAAQIRKVGNGTLTLTNTATNDNYTGTVRIDGGTLSISAVESLGRRGTNRILYLNNGGALGLTADMSFNTRLFRLGTANADGVAGTFDVAGGTTTYLRSIVSNNVAGAGALLKTGNGTLVLEGANTYTGGTIIAAGTIQAGLNQDNLGTGNLTFNGTGATFLAAGNMTDSLRNYILLQTGTIDTSEFDLTLNGDAIGSAGLVKAGTGVLTLNGNNTYAGATLIIGGTLTIGQGRLGAGNYSGDISNSGSLVYASTANQTLGGIISGTGVLTKNGSGTLLLSGNNTYTGATNINAGTMEISATGLLGGGNYSGNITNNANFVCSSTNDQILSGSISGSGGFTKNGSGKLRLSGQNTYTGGTTINAGTLEISATGLLGGGNYSGDISNSGSFVYASSANQMLSGIISGTGSLTKTGSGTLTLSGANSYNGTTTLSEGRLNINSATALGSSTFTIVSGQIDNTGTGPVALNNNAQNWNGDFTFTGTNDLDMGVGAVAMNATRNITVSNGNFTVGGVISGSTFGLAKNGDGTMILSGANTYTGRTTINAGTLAVSGGSAIMDTGTVHLANANGVVLSVLGNETIGSLQGGGTIGGDVNIASSQTLTVIETGSQTFAGSIGGLGSFTKSGSGTLAVNGTNTHAGGTTLNSGTLVAQNTSAMGVGDVTLNGGHLVAQTSLNLAALKWAAGDIRLAPAQGTVLHITGCLTNAGTGGAFAIDSANLVPGNYTLATFGSTDFQVADFSATFLNLDPSVHFQGQFLLNAGHLQFQLLGATANGSLIQNSGGPNIPTFADFTLNGTVQTGGPSDNNSINSLVFESGSRLEIFNTLTATSGNLSVTGGCATITGDILFTPGDLNKSGPGSLFVWSDLLVGGDAYIRSGLLSLNQNMSVNTLFVIPSSILGGVGFIQGSVINQGAVSPGNSIGTLTIAGDYTQTSAGVLNIEIESPSSFDRVVVGGQASIEGKLNVIPYGRNNLTYGQKYDFLQASRIVGTFDTINASEGFRGRFINSSTVGTLLIAPDTYMRVAVTPNQERVAKALDTFILATNGDRLAVSSTLDLLETAQFPAAFDQIMPGFYESLANISIEQAFNQTQMLNQRIGSVRLGAAGFQAMGVISQPLLYDKDGKSAATAKDANPIVASAMATNWNTWALGNGQFSRTTNLSNLLNSNTDAGGFLVGADYRWSENFVNGLYAGYEYTYSKYGSDSNMRGNGVNFGGYASYATEEGYYADAVIGGGYTGFQTRRSIQFSTIDRTAQADPNSAQFSAALNLGKDFEIGKFTLGPIVGAQYTYVGIGGFTETGAESLDLSLGQQEAISLRSTLGGRIAYIWNLNQKIAIIPEVRMFWQHEFLNNARNINASLDGGNGAAFDFETTDPYRDSVFAGAGVTAQFGKNLSGSVFYNVNFGSQTYLGNILSVGVNWTF